MPYQEYYNHLRLDDPTDQESRVQALLIRGAGPLMYQVGNPGYQPVPGILADALEQTRTLSTFESSPRLQRFYANWIIHALQSFGLDWSLEIGLSEFGRLSHYPQDGELVIAHARAVSLIVAGLCDKFAVGREPSLERAHALVATMPSLARYGELEAVRVEHAESLESCLRAVVRAAPRSGTVTYEPRRISGVDGYLGKIRAIAGFATSPVLQVVYSAALAEAVGAYRNTAPIQDKRCEQLLDEFPQLPFYTQQAALRENHSRALTEVVQRLPHLCIRFAAHPDHQGRIPSPASEYVNHGLQMLRLGDAKRVVEQIRSTPGLECTVDYRRALFGRALTTTHIDLLLEIADYLEHAYAQADDPSLFAAALPYYERILSLMADHHAAREGCRKIRERTAAWSLREQAERDSIEATLAQIKQSGSELGQRLQRVIDDMGPDYSPGLIRQVLDGKITIDNLENLWSYVARIANGNS